MVKYIKPIIAVLLLSLVSYPLFSQGIQKKVVINWQGVQQVEGINYEAVEVLSAEGLSNNARRNYTPEYFEKFALPSNIGSCDILITHTEWEPLKESEITRLTYDLQPDEVLTPRIESGTERGIKMALLTLIPVVVNPEGGIMRLKSFTIDIVYIPALATAPGLKSMDYKANSVLAEGNWYKIQVDKTGIYKLTYADIQAMGADMSRVTPGNIRLFGNGGGILPEANNIFRYDDLTENAISIVTSAQGVFAPGDYILFYATGPDRIFYNKVTHKFEHSKNIYSDFSYYFLNFNGEAGLRIGELQEETTAPTYTSTVFTESVFYEKDQLNFINSGKDWVGERMDASSPFLELPAFNFSNLKTGRQSWIRYRVTSRASSATTFAISANGTVVATPSCNAFSNYNYATERIETKGFFPEVDEIRLKLQYNGVGTAVGWLDWIELNVPREMKFTGGQMAFADPLSVMPGTVSEFQLQNSGSDVTIWEVTNPLSVKLVSGRYESGTSKFVLRTDSIRQFVAWDNTEFHKAVFSGKVQNQNLHGISSTDMLIVTHADYLEQANRLAEHHRVADGFKVAVATNEQVYNEFSSGSPDISAIRDLAAMLYHRPAEGSKLRYLLLFGDGSFDFKDRVPANTNRVLTFQTKESLNSVYSFASDDFFGILDPNEGNDAVGLIDIGIGRFPVSTVEQAKMAVDKCIFYATNTDQSMGDWRNKLCFVSDDGNGNTHFRQVEKQIMPLIEEIAPEYNLSKIYLDAFKQISTPSGQRCPDANAAIKSNVENGVLLINYTGHGGETGWADEGILSVREIEAWTNYNNMPVFMTATCEFSRYDDPNRVSAGEHVFLNPVGGGVALFTTTRLANAGTNIGLTLYLYDTLFAQYNGEYPRFGDVIAHAKNKIGANDADLIRNFVLLGDPALRLAYPANKVVTTEINGQAPGQNIDTISAMTPVELKGIITDVAGTKLTDFNGVVDVKVFDKARTLYTLGSEPGDWPDDYTLQDNYIYQGRASVTNGDFTVNFIVPRDIDYSFGPGKISYYAKSSNTDAGGFNEDFIIGGSGDESSDSEGPEIKLFMDDLSFTNGGITGETPLLIAQLSDQSGINTISNAIGHDIVATLDGNSSASVVLNNYYSADIDSYRSGEVRYKFSQLTEGEHTLTLKAWDVFNNSSEATITFTVTTNMQITVTNVTASPNPFIDEVKVDFETNLSDATIEAYLEIFNINGSLVSVTEKTILLSQGYNAGTLTWDGRNASGSKVTRGTYLISVRASNGNSETVKATRVIKFE